jgi:hypothetical protein
MNKEQFMPLWRDAMWHAPDVEERTRLVLEYGRLTCSADGKVTPTVIACTGQSEHPLLMLSLTTAPLQLPADELDALRTQLTQAGTTSVITLVSVAAGAQAGVTSYLLIAWGEESDGIKACWLQPYRWVDGQLEQAPAMMAPDPDQTALANHLSGLLGVIH